MRFHWQNLNDDPERPRWGGGYRYGRAWLTLFHSPDPKTREEEKRIKYRPGTEIGWTWTFFDRGASTGISFAAQRQDGIGLQFRVGVWGLFAFWVHVHGGIAARIATWLLPKLARDQRPRYPGEELPIRDYSDREINVYWFEGALWWRFWTDPMGGWSSSWPWWRRKLQQGSFHPVDFLLGSTKLTEREISRQDVLIPMPERSYQATVIIEERTWRRPRWPFPWHRHLGADVKMYQDPIPHPGKGENSWDCGEDAAYSFPIPRQRFSDAVSYAIGHVVAGQLDTRARRGGRDWRPKEDHRP